MITPGPWESETEYECAVYAHNHQMKIADIRGWGYLTGKGQGGLGLSSAEASKIQNANARAIAEVPEMVKLLKIAKHELLSADNDAPVVDDIEALLERIEGETDHE